MELKMMTLKMMTYKEYIASCKHNYNYNKKEKKVNIEKIQNQIKELKKEVIAMQEEYKQYKFIIPNKEEYDNHIKDLLVFAREHNLKPLINKDNKEILENA